MEENGAERRHTSRIRAANLISYTQMDEHQLVRNLGLAATIDLSETGMKIWSTEPLPLAANIHFELALGEKVVHVTGRVIYAREESPDRFLMGIKFLDSTEIDTTLLRGYLEKRSEPPT